MKSKVVPVEEAVRRISDGGTVSICGAWMQVPDMTLGAIEKSFLERGRPRDLTAVFAICPGGVDDQPGIDHLAHEGLLRRVIGGSYPNAANPVRKLISENRVEAYNLPSGMIASWYRETGAGRPGVLTRKGLGTFVDPRQTGGRMNERTTQDILQVTTLVGREHLFLPSSPFDVAVIRGTTADEAGNLTMEHESAASTAFVQAAAARASGGIVIAQVKRVERAGALNPHHVKVPGTLVDCIVADPDQIQTSGIRYDAALSGEVPRPLPAGPAGSDVERSIARRAAREIRDGDVVVLGYGISAYLPYVLLEEGRFTDATFAVEHGSIGGLPLTEFGFGNSINPQAILDVASQFDLFQGGCFDTAVLSFLQVDQQCRINVHKLNARPHLSVGIGGFLDIAASARRLVFAGYFTAGGGKARKFVKQVDNISFDPRYAEAKEITFVTERAVLRWTNGRFFLEAVGSGVDIDRDVLGLMEFLPDLSRLKVEKGNV